MGHQNGKVAGGAWRAVDSLSQFFVGFGANRFGARPHRLAVLGATTLGMKTDLVFKLIGRSQSVVKPGLNQFHQTFFIGHSLGAVGLEQASDFH